ncbi:hypothetical protein WQ54_16215 [Bacillus sp. SA1-12]|uniref:hypothetical protein n=1 Tax=Bacillus sp. SA1-12 TaxID=1455638 RepID=UPI0006270F2E|nr:hypothetical protein [Bacillus sp. SA1-12]KKI91183.1 hypothetical protein WQ54_16215 [Bacillus sp. SA1-12]
MEIIKRTRKRYLVTIESKIHTIVIVVIAYDDEDMSRILRNQYGRLLVDDNGNRIAQVTFTVTELGKYVAKGDSD